MGDNEGETKTKLARENLQLVALINKQIAEDKKEAERKKKLEEENAEREEQQEPLVLDDSLSPKSSQLVIEAKAERNLCERKVLYHFDESLEALKARGYERHLRPVEAFSLLKRNLEGTLSEEEQKIAKDMLVPWGEWLSLAWERKGNVLVAYLDPLGLVWDKKKSFYAKQDFSYSEERQFDITGKDSNCFLDLKEFPEDFVTWHYGRRFVDSPEEMQEGERRAYVRLPAAGVIRPVCRRGYNNRYAITAVYDYPKKPSRGVKHQCK